MYVNFSELPKPILGDISDLKALSVKIRRDRNPNVLSYRYQELCELDTIKVELVPEKKGLILKHVEYEVTSQVS
jgi:sorting nexin-8